MDEDVRGIDEDTVRVGDAARDAAIAVLREAVGDGRLTLDEFADRAGTTYAATTVADLREALADLQPATAPVPAPVGADPSPSAPPPPVASQRIVAVMSGASRAGRWQVGADVSAVAVMGGVQLDLYDAELSGGVTTIRAFALMGGIEILVPEHVPVEVEGFVLMGGLEDRTRHRAGPSQHAMVRVIGHGMWGGIEVRHRDRKRSTPVAEAPLAVAQAPAPRSAPGFGGDTVTLLFTDIVDSSSLAERVGDQRWLDVLRSHHELVRAEVARHGGEEIKDHGDGFMVAFRSARRALLAAIDIQRALERHRGAHPEEPVHARIGLHTGEVVGDDGDLYGRNVILASRITSQATRDEILASALTKQLADAGGDLGFGAGRSVALKGLSGDWVVHPVHWS